MRVHELAKELGVVSSQLIAELRQQGEYVSSASSVLPAPVIRGLRSQFSSTAAAGQDR